MRTLFIILLVIIILQWLMKRLMPVFLLYMVKNMTKKQFGKAQQQAQKEGTINVNRTITAEKKIDKNVGDYVEYEEII